MSRTRSRLDRLERRRPRSDQIVVFSDWSGAFLTAWLVAADGCHHLTQEQAAALPIVVFSDWSGAFLTAWLVAADGCHNLTQEQAAAWLATHPLPMAQTIQMTWGDATT